MVHLQAIASHLADTPVMVYCTGRWARFNVKLHFCSLGCFQYPVFSRVILPVYHVYYSVQNMKTTLVISIHSIVEMCARRCSIFDHHWSHDVQHGLYCLLLMIECVWRSGEAILTKSWR